jgi:hypothetical protein
VNYVGSAQERHFELWPIDEGYIAPEPGPPSQSYDEEISKLKEWINLRINWLDENIPELSNEIINNIQKPDQEANKQTTYRLFPNPATNYFYVGSSKHIKEIKIYNVVGQQVSRLELGPSYSEKIRINRLPSGLYFIKLIRQDGNSIIHKHIFRK